MKPSVSPGRHLYTIDLIRFAAALLVAFFHLTWQEAATAPVGWFGWIGVQIFFVISGFVIARSANDTTPLRFVQSRVLRLYPCAWICASIGVVVLAAIHWQQPDLGARFLASFLLSPVGPFLVSAYWTLPIELAFYLLIFLLLAAGRFSHLETVAVTLCLVSTGYNVAYALQRAGAFAWPDLEFGYDWKNLTLLRHGIYFGIGILIWIWSCRRLRPASGVSLAVATGGAMAEIGCRSTELAQLVQADIDRAALFWLPASIWLVFLAAIAWSARWEPGRLAASKTGQSVVRAAGLATYPLYLLHEEVGLAARNILVRLHVPLLTSVVVALLGTSVLALVVARWLEPRVRNALRSAVEMARGSPWLLRLKRPGGIV